MPFSSRHLVEAYQSGAERFGWSKRNTEPGARREGEWLIGMGCATATYPYFRMPGGAARLKLTKDGHATVEISAHEMGMGTATVQAQVTAERLGLPIEKVTVAYGDSRFPGVVLAGGSQQTASIGASVIAAQRALVTELLKLAGKDSALSGLKPDEVGGRDGGLCKLDEPARFESDPHVPIGAHGVGEIGITGVGAAVANAIYNACGKLVRDLPITLDKLL